VVGDVKCSVKWYVEWSDVLSDVMCWVKSYSCFFSIYSFYFQGTYKLSEEFAKPYFYKFWTEIHDVTTIWNRNVCSFIVTLNAFDVRPRCDTADVQTILPFPPNPPKPVSCDVPDYGVDALSQFWQCVWMWWDVNIVLDETPQEEITHCQVWWPGWPGAGGVVCGRCTTNSSTWHVFI